MAFLFVARSAALGQWASDVGLGKHVYKVGIVETDPKPVATAAGWAGETDWTVIRKQEIEGLSEADAIERLSRKEKMIDPRLYPKLKGMEGVFRLSADRVGNHLLVARALAGEPSKDMKLKPADFAAYLIQGAIR